MTISDTQNEPEYKLAHRLTGAVVMVLGAILIIPQILKEPHFERDIERASFIEPVESEDGVKIFRSKIEPANSLNSSSGSIERRPNTDGQEDADGLISIVAPQRSVTAASVSDLTESVDNSLETQKEADPVTTTASTPTESVQTAKPALKISGATQAIPEVIPPTVPTITPTDATGQEVAQEVAQETTTKVAEVTTKKATEDDKKEAVGEAPLAAQPKEKVTDKIVLVKKTEPEQNESAPASDENTAQGAPKEGWVVRVGTFSKKTNAVSLTNLLIGKGLKAQTTQVKTSFGDATRIWLGPYADKKIASEISERLKALTGENGYITKYANES